MEVVCTYYHTTKALTRDTKGAYANKHTSKALTRDITVAYAHTHTS